MIDKDTFIEMLETATENDEIVSAIEGAYNITLPEQARRMVSLSDAPQFTEDWRTVSFEELLNSTEYLKYGFVDKGLLPVVDVSDNDYIVFNSKSEMWEKYNIIDELSFDEAEDIKELLQ